MTMPTQMEEGPAGSKKDRARKAAEYAVHYGIGAERLAEALRASAPTVDDAAHALRKFGALMDTPEYREFLARDEERREAGEFFLAFTLGTLGVVLALVLPWLLS